MNEALEPVLSLVRREPGLAIVALAGSYVILLGLVVWSLARYGRLAKKQARLLRGAEGASLERMLLDHVDTAADMRGRLSHAADNNAANAAQIRQCFQRIGVIRYDAFPDVGGEQSFSLALLDADDNGLVISSLFSRNHMRVYAKTVEKGSSPQSLTDEEKQAIATSHNESAGRSNSAGAPPRQRGGGSGGGDTARTVAR